MVLSFAGCAQDEVATEAVDVVGGGGRYNGGADAGAVGAADAENSIAVKGDSFMHEAEDFAPSEGVLADGDYEEYSFSDAVGDSAVAEGGVYEDCYGEEVVKCPVEEDYIRPKAGLLTGGEWRDNDHWNDWVSLYQSHQDWDYYRDLWEIDFDSRHEVIVTANGVPVEGAVVSQGDGAVATAVTDNQGRAYLFFEDCRSDTQHEITATYNGVSASIGTSMEGDCSYKIDLGQVEVESKKALDLMLMVDTTGSMSDELMYLQKELEDVIERVKHDNANLDIRVSVNFYRDKGDDYVTRCYKFTENINDALDWLEEQDANGGGDFPEAVHTAMDDAINEHEWNDNATKLMFFVLDAPPHADAQIIDEVNEHISDAAAEGIRIIPVASSGIDKSTEYLLRAMAFMTGGTYTFLTDDSGIGGSHIEPTIGDYQVERLNDMMVRIINDYLE